MRHDDDARFALRRLLGTRQIVVCVGSGGVGKTTTAASLGLAAAALGRKTLVITIDPARRLANALGLDALLHRPQPVDDALVRAARARLGPVDALPPFFPLPSKGGDGHESDSAPDPGGADGRVEVAATAPASLSAMMLDLKAGWDDMLFRTAPDKVTAEKILLNRFYRVLSTELPGAHEFIACEHLHHLASSGAWDLVVLDTPPTQNALDFLDAPQRILGVLDNDAFRLLAHKAPAEREPGLASRFLEGATGRAQSVIAKFTGQELLDELGDLLLLLKDLYGPLTQRTREFVALLSGRHSAFVVVTAPQPAVLAEASFFAGELRRRALPLAAAVINRVTPRPTVALEALGDDVWSDRLSEVLGPDDAVVLAAALDTAVRQEARLADLEARTLLDLTTSLSEIPCVRLPRLSDAVHDADRLVELLPWLVGADGGSAS
jgi:anion-transporting  ArsA/GET3 family ATPase